jgi:hypothetical protein
LPFSWRNAAAQSMPQASGSIVQHSGGGRSKNHLPRGYPEQPKDQKGVFFIFFWYQNFKATLIMSERF